MSEDAPHKSHVWHLIIGIVLALTLYVGSAVPVRYSFYSKKGPWLPPSWEEPVLAFFKPADWFWRNTPLEMFGSKWVALWASILDAH